MSLGALSRALNRVFGGKPGWSLCARWAEGFGPNCIACRLIGRVLSEPDHCAEELAWYLNSPEQEKTMELLSNWQDVIKRAWSMKLMGFAVFLEIAQELVPYLSEYLPWWCSILIILVGMGARLVKQESLSSSGGADAEE